jgi:hypothetical protein
MRVIGAIRSGYFVAVGQQKLLPHLGETGLAASRCIDKL